ncbi:MAG: AAA family ATPase [Thermomicrobiales bacterium]
MDFDTVVDEAIRRVEQGGIVFIDEIDKIATPGGGHGPDVSDEGVQRDLLPIVEGTVVSTRYGPVKTDHILFIGAGVHRRQAVRSAARVPGTLPAARRTRPLGEDELYAILTEPENALAKQYTALLATEDVTLTFAEDGLREIAAMASCSTSARKTSARVASPPSWSKPSKRSPSTPPRAPAKRSPSTPPSSATASATSSATKTSVTSSCSQSWRTGSSLSLRMTHQGIDYLVSF